MIPVVDPLLVSLTEAPGGRMPRVLHDTTQFETALQLLVSRGGSREWDFVPSDISVSQITRPFSCLSVTAVVARSVKNVLHAHWQHNNHHGTNVCRQTSNYEAADPTSALL